LSSACIRMPSKIRLSHRLRVGLDSLNIASISCKDFCAFVICWRSFKAIYSGDINSFVGELAIGSSFYKLNTESLLESISWRISASTISGL
jgi:hypothetical protein